MRNPTPPVEITHVKYRDSGGLGDRPSVKVRIRDTETSKNYNVTFTKYEAHDAEGIVIRSPKTNDADVEDTTYWRLSGHGGAGAADEHDALFRVAMIQIAGDHLRRRDDLTIKFTSDGSYPSPACREPEYVWFGSRGGKKRHLAAARDATSFCGNVSVGWPQPVDDDFDVDSYRVCKTCRKKYYEQTETDDG